MSEPKLIKERMFSEAILQDADGKIIHNSVQQDDPVIVLDYDDGMRHLLSRKTGKPISAPFDPTVEE